MQAAWPRSYEMEIAVSHAIAFFQSLPVPFQLLLVLVALMLIDIIVAVIIASWEGRISSKIAWRGVSKKALTLLGVATAATIQPALAYLPGNSGAAATAIALSVVIGMYIFVELCSVVESFGKAGMEIPLITPFARRVTAAMNASVATEQRGSIAQPDETRAASRS